MLWGWKPERAAREGAAQQQGAGRCPVLIPLRGVDPLRVHRLDLVRNAESRPHPGPPELESVFQPDL